MNPPNDQVYSMTVTEKSYSILLLIRKDYTHVLTVSLKPSNIPLFRSIPSDRRVHTKSVTNNQSILDSVLNGIAIFLDSSIFISLF